MLLNAWILPRVKVKNRIVRSATYEGMADRDGYASAQLSALYTRLAESGTGLITTGFCYTSREGRAMQPLQCGIDGDDKIPAWEKIVAAVKARTPDVTMVMQISHCGRQTISKVTRLPVWAPCGTASSYFREKPLVLHEDKIAQVIREFGLAAARARRAGFDGVQIHAAHGYLIHQFLSPALNTRKDKWGLDRYAFLGEILSSVREACGEGFPVFVKMSGRDDHPGGMSPELAGEYVKRMKAQGVEAVEISYGTMDLPMNIFRGGTPVDRALEHNILFCRYPAWVKRLWRRFVYPRWKRKFLPFTENYNLEDAGMVRRISGMPVILVGGIRRIKDMEDILTSGKADAIALCRPLICEPDLVKQFIQGQSERSRCTNCNLCAVMCDSVNPVRCYMKEDRNADREDIR